MNPIKSYDLFEFKYVQSTVYQEPQRFGFSIGVDYSMFPVLLHIHFMFWEIDFKFGSNEDDDE